MNRICVIVNPAARGSKARQALTRLRQLMGRDAVLKATRGPGDAEAQAERAVEQGYDTVIAAGGDGTVNEVVNGLNGAPVNFGVLPCGTINVFAMELGIPFDLDAAWRVIRGKKTRLVDLAEANGHTFVQMAGIGLDAQIVERTDRNIRRALGPLSYLLTATQVAAERPPRLRVLREGHEPLVGSFVLVGNGRLYGGPVALFHEADIHDGLLDVCVFHHMNHLALMRYVRGALFGSLARFSDVDYFKTRQLRVEADRQVPWEADGELIGHLPVDFRVRKRKLRVLVPS